ncbi:hypothetical protein DMN91_009184 [Ooceraea biroi]|uniref:Uncharacterized protein n=1 Tax=Ooceraea biroi TaxID=2015173 RepID=A0A3L8DEC4_OOCBI|nr:hypothetical protein DMN91_009184 [Ooceraea biroi]
MDLAIDISFSPKVQIQRSERKRYYPLPWESGDFRTLENGVFAKFVKESLKERSKDQTKRSDWWHSMGDYKVRASDQMSVERSVFMVVKLHENDGRTDVPAKRGAAVKQKRKREGKDTGEVGCTSGNMGQYKGMNGDSVLLVY